jgi:hypothetical protein
LLSQSCVVGRRPVIGSWIGTDQGEKERRWNG